MGASIVSVYIASKYTLANHQCIYNFKVTRRWIISGNSRPVVPGVPGSRDESLVGVTRT